MLAIIATLTAGAPYADTQGRFRLDLPASWQLAPKFGDTEGMRFVRRFDARRGGRVVHLEIAVRETDAEGWAARWRADRRGAGFSVRAARAARTGARALSATKSGRAERCSFLDGAPNAVRVCVAGRATDLRLVKREVQAILRSVRLPTARVAPPPPAVAAPPPAGPPPELFGVFVGASGAKLELTEGGSYRLGRSAGRYRVDGDTLTLEPTTGARRSFGFALKGDRLILRSPALDKPVIYTRAKAGADPSVPAKPTGTWRVGKLELVLAADGGFELGKARGQWVAEEGILRLRHEKGDVVSYDMTYAQDSLRLEGGDIDDSVVFHRVR